MMIDQLMFVLVAGRDADPGSGHGSFLHGATRVLGTVQSLPQGGAFGKLREY
jgi:hypothetical protein